jgi:predicted HTH domain antitoxin
MGIRSITMTLTISRTDLARNTREIVEQVRGGQTIVVQSYGQDQIVLLDMLDYKILRALVNYAVKAEQPETVLPDDELAQIIRAYLDERINLGKASEKLGLSRFELMDRFERLGVPLRIGPATLDEAREEVKAAQQTRTSGT